MQATGTFIDEAEGVEYLSTEDRELLAARAAAAAYWSNQPVGEDTMDDDDMDAFRSGL